MANLIPIEHPGRILKEEFMVPLDVTAYQISKETGISETALSQIIKGTRGISISNALKLSLFFGLSDEYFANLQMRYTLDLEKEKGCNITAFVPKNKRPSEDETLLEV